MELLKNLLLLSVLAVAVAGDDHWDCPDHCQCDWVTGNKAANCSYAGFSSIPTLTPEIQIVNFTGNTLTEISTNGLKNAGLINVNRLYLRDCKLTKIKENGLSGMASLIELDLSKNYLKTLRNDTFQELHSIARIVLDDNQLEKLEDGLFSNLPNLLHIELSNNKISQIGDSCFVSVPRVSYLTLDHNRLEYLNVDTVNKLNSLARLELSDNPWHCNCNLQPLIKWSISKNLFASHIVTCTGKLLGKSWYDLDAIDFACQPDNKDIVSTTDTDSANNPPARMLLDIPDAQITISCRVNGQPIAEFYRYPTEKDWEIKYYRCGDYICFSSGESTEVVKISKALNQSENKN